MTLINMVEQINVIPTKFQFKFLTIFNYSFFKGTYIF